jgi:hypothetical protein
MEGRDGVEADAGCSRAVVHFGTVMKSQTEKLPKLPRVICRLCRRLFHEPGAPLQWYANAHGRATCPNCRN